MGGIGALLMSPTQATSIITTALSTYGTEIKVILTAVLVLGVAYLVFKFGWRMIQGTTVTNWAWLDRKLYKPYKGYNRFRSKDWNLKHTLN